VTLKLIGSAILLMTAVLGCTGVPKGLKPVSDFDGQRYMGKWYEIARLDHSFERNLSNVSATRARFIGDNTVGSLKVSFFGPFYGGYHVIALDKENYSYAMVAGPNLSYLWILSRSTSLDETILSNLTDNAAEWGFKTTELVAVEHDRPDE
jgi:apolipoprotein D and lipocalin family protein